MVELLEYWKDCFAMYVLTRHFEFKSHLALHPFTAEKMNYQLLLPAKTVDLVPFAFHAFGPTTGSDLLILCQNFKTIIIIISKTSNSDRIVSTSNSLATYFLALHCEFKFCSGHPWFSSFQNQ